jgi:hypothetical protein
VIATAAFTTASFPQHQAAHPSLTAALMPHRVAPLGTPPPPLTVREAVRMSVSAAVRRRRIPDALAPSLGDLRHDVFDVSACSAHDGSRSPICHWGDRSARRLMVVVGDSHAQMWMPAAIAFARHYHWNLVPLVKIGCVPVNFTRGTCGDWYRWTLTELRRLHPRLIVLSEFWASWGSAGAAAVQREFADMRGLARHVALLEDPPSRTQTALDCLLRKGATLGSCVFPVSDRQRSTYRSVRGAAAAIGVSYVPTLQWICFRGQCPTVVGNVITYRDDHHITLTYARLLKVLIAARIERAIR